MSRAAVLRASILCLLGEAPCHGYAMVDRVTQLGIERPSVRCVYTALRRFEAGGLVTSSWEHRPTGPARRVYRLTSEGARAAGPGVIGGGRRPASAGDLADVRRIRADAG